MTDVLTIDQVERLHWWMLAAVTLVAALVPGASPVSLAAGGLFMGTSVNLMKRLVARLVRPGGRLAPALALLTAKTALFLGLLVLLFKRIPIDGMSFAGGATVFLVAAVVSAVRSGERSRGES